MVNHDDTLIGYTTATRLNGEMRNPI